MRLAKTSFIWNENNKVIEQSLKNQEILDKVVKLIQDGMVKSHVEMSSYCKDPAVKIVEEAKLNTLRFFVDQIPELRQHLIDSGTSLSNVMMQE